ncbi:M3 family metallopeptidase [Corynebacterium sp. sy039]|uniref:M3 family metallopeptidase n=1 Tax=Corynebacterium sp. sy039 TaxID=2599641 RepID=UPI0011B81219|nr:M3 family metallopeptidase [Corynebacterium sp. sy039]QDZ43025.1 M3 family metallopeptidase [Corynebacterium sp. sy039]
MSEHNTQNPFFSPSTLPYALPDFQAINPSHYEPAVAHGIAQQRAEITDIINNPAEATWENTVEAFERSGAILNRTLDVFFNLLSTDSTEELEGIAERIIPALTAHDDDIYLNHNLYQRIAAVTPPQDAESERLHEHLLRLFTRRGAQLEGHQRERLKEINTRLSVLSDQFGRNLLKDTKELAVSFDNPEQLAGLSPSRIASAAEDAAALGKSGTYVLPLELPTVQSEQANLTTHQARAALYEASQQRGKTSNAQLVIETVQLRAERARLLGYDTHADYVIAEETAGSARAARELLYDLAPAAVTNAEHELKLLSEATSEEITAADWPYWESRVRARDFDLDEEELSHYFPLRQVLIDGVFYAAQRLYGISVEPRPDLKGYAEGVEVWEVKEEDGTGIGLFVTDYYARPSKRGGAWMSSFVNQSQLLDSKPVVVNVMGITKPADGSEALLSIDNLTTLFHEFGHALHGLLSNVRYPSFSGTNVPRDYVEFPSQINENWAFDPVILRNYARHITTGEVISDELVAAIEKSRQFGQGFATTEYLAAAIIDLAWHSLSPEQAAQLSAADIEQFEKEALAAAGIELEQIAPRYRSTYFNHIFAGGYSAGYYSYLWAEALDADGFDWFQEQGAAGTGETDTAARQAGQRFRDVVLSRGGADDYTQAFIALRGREKDITPLLRRRGLSGAL